jgi:hypothetical protein
LYNARLKKASSYKTRNSMSQTNFNEYFKHYIDLVNSTEAIEALNNSGNDFQKLIKSVDDEKGLYQYEDGKWSIKELISHVIDAERVFAYRAMSFARNDKNNLAGFDDHLYASNSGANDRTMASLVDEFTILRQASIALFNSLDDEMWNRSGTANNITIDVKSLAYLIAGHCRHHENILRERYLV